ncbi:hypothetical protein [Gracilibacillus alcaliphilus]|uniref:hypothetical protein n=1 Tax=Gracilibacillus alcaliphilus TaxID=1401441 RepID=UPI00195820F7|nr:hypothetical protein [Gracilibacillus alcaliphilus]MBM7679471.1 hypothetical protein [Gracilibacillus alcaliphilus]
MSKSGLFIVILLFIFAVVWTSMSTPSEEEILAEAVDAAQVHFEQEAHTPNTILEHFSLYVPADFEIVEESDSNVLVKQGDQTYLLFHNPIESDTSQLHYEVAKAADNSERLVSFENKERFGYINIVEDSSGYELQLGVGGTKITTITDQSKLVDNSIHMMDMIRSINYKEGAS